MHACLQQRGTNLRRQLVALLLDAFAVLVVHAEATQAAGCPMGMTTRWHCTTRVPFGVKVISTRLRHHERLGNRARHCPSPSLSLVTLGGRSEALAGLLCVILYMQKARHARRGVRGRGRCASRVAVVFSHCEGAEGRAVSSVVSRKLTLSAAAARSGYSSS